MEKMPVNRKGNWENNKKILKVSKDKKQLTNNKIQVYIQLSNKYVK